MIQGKIPARPAPLPAALWLALLALAFCLYTLAYFATPALPGNPEAPEGWWGWFDQGEYLKSVQAFAGGTWRSVAHYYPPLYPWLGSLFVSLWPGHPFFLVDFAGLALHLAALVVVGRRLATWPVVLAAIVATFLLFPGLTVTQWTTPWTTSVSAGLTSLMLLVAARFDARGWRLDGPGGIVALILFSFAWGSMIAVRPLEVVVDLPLALAVYWRLFRTETGLFRRDFRPAAALRLAVPIVVAGLVGPALFVAFNLATAGTPLGAYVRYSQGFFEFHSLLRKTLSLLFDSATLYVEPGQALADGFWPLPLALAVVAGALVWGTTLARLVALTVLAQIALYIPYGDLLPNGLFRYLNIHYFAWTFPWLVLLILAQVEAWLRLARARPVTVLAEVLLVAGLAVIAGGARLKAGQVDPVALSRPAPDELAGVVETPRPVDAIDISGPSGGWSDIYFGGHRLVVNGTDLKPIAAFRLLPTEDGIRIVLGRTLRVQSFALHLDPNVTVPAEVSEARVVTLRAVWHCPFDLCRRLRAAVRPGA